MVNFALEIENPVLPAQSDVVPAAQLIKLGLDLQGGMSVTMEVGLSDLIKSLANYTKDPVFTKALEDANARKANSGADLISLFNEELVKKVIRHK